MTTAYLNKGKATVASVEAAAKRYRDLVKQQRAMPLAEQWTMGSVLGAARAAWQVEREELAAIK